MTHTHNASTRLETLRELLYAAPSKKTWIRICKLFDNWPAGEDLDTGLNYAMEHLASWPEDINGGFTMGWPISPRNAPKPWLNALLAGKDQPAGWPLVRMVQLHYTIIRPSFFTELLASATRLQNVTHLYLGGVNLELGDVIKILDAPALDALTHLMLYGNTLKGCGPIFAEHPRLAQLTYLDLGACDLIESDVLALASSPYTNDLTALGLGYNNNVTGDNLPGLLSPTSFPNIEWLLLERAAHDDIDITPFESTAPHLLRAIYAGQVASKSPYTLKTTCKAQGLRGFSKKRKGEVVDLLLDAWDRDH